ncbi:MAG: hypothetical protein ACK58T_37020 [Phycisphaerae bacterium]
MSADADKAVQDRMPTLPLENLLFVRQHFERELKRQLDAVRTDAYRYELRRRIHDVRDCDLPQATRRRTRRRKALPALRGEHDAILGVVQDRRRVMMADLQKALMQPNHRYLGSDGQRHRVAMTDRTLLRYLKDLASHGKIRHVPRSKYWETTT